MTFPDACKDCDIQYKGIRIVVHLLMNSQIPSTYRPGCGFSVREMRPTFTVIFNFTAPGPRRLIAVVLGLAPATGNPSPGGVTPTMHNVMRKGVMEENNEVIVTR